MHFRQKLAFFVFGCVFVIAGQVVTGLVVPSATAQGGLQDAEFDTVTAREFVVDAPSGLLASLGVSGGGVALTLSGTDDTVAMVVADREGVGVLVLDTVTDEGAVMKAGDGSGAVLGMMRKKIDVVTLTAENEGGLVFVADKHGEHKASIGVDKNGDGYAIP